MNEDAIYQSKNAKILRSSVEIRGHLLNPSAIKGISFFDEQQQAYRWVKITGTILLFAMCLSFLTGEAGRVGLVVVVGTILGLVFVIGYALFPTAGAGLVIAGLAAAGETEIIGLEYIDRGYERLEELLSDLGGQVQRSSGVTPLTEPAGFFETSEYPRISAAG